MEIKKKKAWKNQRCQECYKTIGEGNDCYLVRVKYARAQGGTWRLCKECCEKLFKMGNMFG